MLHQVPRRISAAINMTGDAAIVYGGPAAVDGTSMAFTPGAGQLAWAIYQFDAGSSVRLSGVSYSVSGLAAGATVWMFASNYNTGTWEVHSSQNASDTVPLADAASGRYSAGGSVFVAVAGYGESFTLDTLRLNTTQNAVQPLALDASEAGPNSYDSLAVVDGFPALSYLDEANSRLLYVRATDENGAAWGTPVVVDGSGFTGFDSSLAVIDGAPAISYFDQGLQQLRYVRALDPDGATWGLPVSPEPGVIGREPSLASVAGSPAIAFHDTTNGSLRFVRSADAAGAGWPASLPLDDGDDLGHAPSLAIVAGNPAISYYDTGNGVVKFIRAADPTGASWGLAIGLNLSQSAVGTSLAEVGGTAMIVYEDNGNLIYRHAATADGLTWETEQFLAVGTTPTLRIIDGNPAISYYDWTNQHPAIVFSTVPQGNVWGFPVAVAAGNSAFRPSLAEVNGWAGLAYYDLTLQKVMYTLVAPQ